MPTRIRIDQIAEDSHSEVEGEVAAQVVQVAVMETPTVEVAVEEEAEEAVEAVEVAPIAKVFGTQADS